MKKKMITGQFRRHKPKEEEEWLIDGRKRRGECQMGLKGRRESTGGGKEGGE